MAWRYLKINLWAFIISYLAIIIFLSFLSYKFFIRNFNDLQLKQNLNNVHTLLFSIQHTFDKIEKSAQDYANWDETYDFANKINQAQYLESNFRSSTNTLEYLNIDYILYTTTKDILLFDDIIANKSQTDKIVLREQILSLFNTTQAISTFFAFNNRFFYLIKTPISNSDATAKSNGYLYMAKEFHAPHIKNINTVFQSIQIETQTNKQAHHTNQKYQYFNYAIEKSVLNAHHVSSVLNLFNNHNDYIMTLRIFNNATIVKNGEEAIFTYNILISFIILGILLVIYINHRKITAYNNLLEARVKRRTMQVTNSLRKLQRQNVDLYNLANKDYLTGINNRRNYFQESEQALKNAIAQNRPFSILIMDIDHFKAINDKYGHAIGDKVLVKFCELVNSILDKNAIFGRIGGEEFCISFKNTTMDEAYKVAQNIRLKCEQTPIHVEDDVLHFTVSLGLNDRSSSDNIDELLHNADELLYNAKTSGRNRIRRNLS